LRSVGYQFLAWLSETERRAFVSTGNGPPDFFSNLLMRTLTVLSLLFALPLVAQHRVDPKNTYNRVITVVPLVGKGTTADPKRPQYAPWPPPPPGTRTGIIAYSLQLSDDRQSALVEFVAVDRAALLPVLNDKSLKTFEKGKSKKDDIIRELKKYRKDFDIEHFGTVLP